jgi:hypothetical protein
MMTTLPLMRFNKANTPKRVMPVEIIRHESPKEKSAFEKCMDKMLAAREKNIAEGKKQPVTYPEKLPLRRSPVMDHMKQLGSEI